MEKSAPPRRSRATEPVLLLLPSSGNGRSRRHRDRGRGKLDTRIARSNNHITTSQPASNFPSMSSSATSSTASFDVARTMCFCCCCCYCSRNCLDCNTEAVEAGLINEDRSEKSLPVITGSRAQTCASDLQERRVKRKPPPIMSKCWHWMMLLMILALFGVTMSLLASKTTRGSMSCTESRRGLGTWGRQLFSRGEVGRDGEHYYSYNYSNSYHYGQLQEKDGGGGRVKGGGRSIALESDSLGDGDPLMLQQKQQQQKRGLLQRILDRGIKSIQFLRSHYYKRPHSCTATITGQVVVLPRGDASDEHEIYKKKKMLRLEWNKNEEDANYSNAVVLLVLSSSSTANVPDPQSDPLPAASSELWTLTNGHQNYHVSIVTSFRTIRRSNSSRRSLSISQQRRRRQHQEMLSQSFVVKNQFPIGFNRLTRAAAQQELADNKDDLEAEKKNTRSDNPIVLVDKAKEEEEDNDGRDKEIEAEDESYSWEPNTHSGQQQPTRRSFHFLRKLQFFDEGEDEEAGEDNTPGSDVTVEGDLQEEEDIPQISSIVQPMDLRNQVMIVGANPLQRLHPSNSNNPQDQASITMRGLERFLELIRRPKRDKAISSSVSVAPWRRTSSSSSSSSLSASPLSSTSSRNRQSQLFRLEQRLSRGRPLAAVAKGAKKCKLNGKAATCRRRGKGMRRKPSATPPPVVVVAEADSSHIDKEKSTTTRGSNKSNTRKSSGDKWKFILENFCAKSHLHGQLPKLIASLEQQEAAAKKRQREQQEALAGASKPDHGQRTTNYGKEKVQQTDNINFANEDLDMDDLEDDEDDELTMTARTTDSLRLEVIKEQILKKLGLKRAPNITNTWTAPESSHSSPPPVDGMHNDSSSGGGDDSKRMVEKKTDNLMFGNGPTGIQLPNNNSQFFIHDGHTRPMDQELFLSKELILATLYRAQLDSGVGHQYQRQYNQQNGHEEGGGGGYANPSSGQPANRLFDDLHAEDGRGRRKRRKGRKRKRREEEGGVWPVQNDSAWDEDEAAYLERRASEDLKSHTRRYLEEDNDEDEEDFDEQDAFEERNHRYHWQNNQQDDGQPGGGDEENYGQSREIITFAERGKLLNGRQNLLEFKPVGDHQTPGGGDFRIRSAVLWLKVEHLNKQQQEQQQGSSPRNVTIWIFNMKTSGWESHSTTTSPTNVNDCPVSNGSASSSSSGAAETTTTTNSDGKVVRNCPSSKFTSYEAADEEARKRQNMDANTNQQLNLDEKDFDRVSELTLTHTIHMPSSTKYDYHAPEMDSGGGRGKFSKNINREDVNFVPSTGGDQEQHRQQDKHSSPLSSNGWHKFDITSVVRRWNVVNRGSVDGQRPVNLQLLVDCTGCRQTGVHVHLFHNNNNNNNNNNAQQPPLVNENRPFLVAHTEPNAMKRVRRRAVDCSGAQNGRCCKQRFYVSFKAIGWDDWIIFPHGYFANYCRGSCAYRTPDMLPTKYSQFMGEFRRLGKIAEMQPCCAPLKFSSMDLIYYDHDRKIIKSNLPQMIVDECGCP